MRLSDNSRPHELPKPVLLRARVCEVFGYTVPAHARRRRPGTATAVVAA